MRNRRQGRGRHCLAGQAGLELMSGPRLAQGKVFLVSGEALRQLDANQKPGWETVNNPWATHVYTGCVNG
jgi:hypothetical protein